MSETIERVFTDLAEETPLANAFLPSDENASLSISQPIDRGAEKLLSRYENAYLTYPPHEVEYLVQTLNEHLANCLELRLKAQELEVRAFTEASDQLLQRKLLATIRKQAELFASNEPNLLANTVKAKVADGAVSGDLGVTYWQDMLREQINQIEQRLEDANLRLARLGEDGGGTNYVERFEFLKQIFNIDLVEAYCRARAASVGLKHIYGITTEVPPLTDTGYLNKLTLWARTVTYELEKKFFNIRETTLAFALNDGSNETPLPTDDVPQIMRLDNFRNLRSGGSFTFKIEKGFFERSNLNLKNPRLRGLDVHLWVNEKVSTMQFWRVFVKAPTQKIEIGSGIPPLTYEPNIFIPLATYPSHVAETEEVSNQREVHNVNPIGEWTIRIEPKSITGLVTNNNDNVDNLILRMRVGYEKN